MPLRRCILYVPSSNARMLQRSASVNVDSVVYDLEDSVPTLKKNEARKNVSRILYDKHHATAEQLVRINDLSTSYGMEDINSIVSSLRTSIFHAAPDLLAASPD